MMDTKTFASLITRLWGLDKRQTWTFLAFLACVLVWYASMHLGYPRVAFACLLPLGLLLICIVRIGEKKAKERAERAEQEQERPYDPGPCLCFSCCNFQPKNTSHEQEKIHE